MSLRAGIVVTGTEVLTGRVVDRNGPWLADRLEEAGVDLAHIAIVGDRRADLLAALRFMAEQGMDVVLTSGGLGPTADDLTTEVVAEFQGRELAWDAALQERIEAIVAPFQRRWRGVDPEAMRVGARKQAMVPEGATVLDPVGTAPGLVVPPGVARARAWTGTPSAPQRPLPRDQAAEDRATGHPSPPDQATPGRATGHPSPPDQATPGRATGHPSPPDQATAGRAAGHRARAPTVIVLPGPPRELQPMWEAAMRAGALREALAGAGEYNRRTLRLFGIPESEIAQTLREAEREGIELERLEITTCLKRGEVEVVTRFEPGAQDTYGALVELVRRRHAETLFSEDGATIDEQVAALLRAHGLTIATAESCTGGLLAARLTELPGASDYVHGAIVAYANEVKIAQAGVPAESIERHGAVSREVAEALAEGARTRLQADVGVGVTGIAGPGGGTPEKSVGLVWLSVMAPAAPASGSPGRGAGGVSLTRSVHLPGGRVDVRDRATTVALHLVRRLLLGESDG